MHTTVHFLFVSHFICRLLLHQDCLDSSKIRSVQQTIPAKIPCLPIRKHGVRHGKQPPLQQHHIRHIQLSITVHVSRHKL